MRELLKHIVVWSLLSGCVIAPSAWGFETNYDKGRVDFNGQVTDISCSVTLNGDNLADKKGLWLAPVSLAEVYAHKAGAFLKPQSFTLELTSCQLGHGKRSEVHTVNVRWIDGFLLNHINKEQSGLLANTLADGAQNIYLALSTNDNNTLDSSNKIVPADPLQNQVHWQRISQNRAVFTYYVGYVSPTPKKATSGLFSSWATWELIYN